LDSKYELIKKILKNGDICEMKTYDGKLIFGFYMDGCLYKDQDNNVIVELRGFELLIVAIRRPSCIRNAFACFKYGDLYNYRYAKYGTFETVYSE
jgi:hypothetical protein